MFFGKMKKKKTMMICMCVYSRRVFFETDNVNVVGNELMTNKMSCLFFSKFSSSFLYKMKFSLFSIVMTSASLKMMASGNNSDDAFAWWSESEFEADMAALDDDNFDNNIWSPHPSAEDDFYLNNTRLDQSFKKKENKTKDSGHHHDDDDDSSPVIFDPTKFFTIIIDAGSKGSRLTLFQWDLNELEKSIIGGSKRALVFPTIVLRKSIHPGEQLMMMMIFLSQVCLIMPYSHQWCLVHYHH
jgi:hypothetical protein